jgi:hypothetical protein
LTIIAQRHRRAGGSLAIVISRLDSQRRKTLLLLRIGLTSFRTFPDASIGKGNLKHAHLDRCRARVDFVTAPFL